jgi:hypothetical protein
LPGDDAVTTRTHIVAMSDTEIVITFQSERELWYVQRGTATAMVSAEDMVHEYYRWRYIGAPGVWRQHATEFCRKKLEPRPKRIDLSGGERAAR